MGRRMLIEEYMKLRSDDVDMIGSGMHELRLAAARLMSDVAMLGFGTGFLKWLASFAAIYLLIVDRWRTNMLTCLLVSYIFISIPSVIFNFFSGGVGQWVAFVAVVLRLFSNKCFLDWLEILGALILLLVVAPSFFADTLRDNWIGIGICLIIASYILQEHIIACGGFRASFTQPHGISKTVRIMLLLVYPIIVYYYPMSTIRC